jgi:cyclopropane-fatty-acyl-phospholipid synthase
MLQSQILKMLEGRLRQHCLPVAVELWNGTALRLSDQPSVTLKINNPRELFNLAKPSLGKLARSYVKRGLDFSGPMRDIIGMGERLCEKDMVVNKKGHRALSWWKHSKPADGKNISHHYDVSNDFYALWLDARRVYSCAYFKQTNDTLDRAQEQKLEHICQKLNLQPNDDFLDIGCGWGGLILWAAEHYGVRATGITLSQNQHDYVQAQIQAHGLQDRVTVHLMDYRDVPEDQLFDKIASVGMFEHVGHHNLPKYFAKIYRLLKPGGLVMNHGITSAGLDTVGLGSGISDFIEEYVFPGGELVHVSHVIESLSTYGLECWDVECLRPHYARTLWHWVDRLEAHAEQAKEIVGEEKYRVWQIYMAGSAHAFERGWMSIFQILGGKPLPNGTMPYPLTREHVYQG